MTGDEACFGLQVVYPGSHPSKVTPNMTRRLDRSDFLEEILHRIESYIILTTG
jgi:hypothetical protein